MPRLVFRAPLGWPQVVTITCAGTAVGRHRRRWAKHQTITDPAHRGTGFGLAHQGPATAQAARLGVGDAGHVVVERRDLSVDDAVFKTTPRDPPIDD